ncbi:hypothetical protein GOP47_0005024 [Adiantum capillus-veneris]|uniref:EF-hand domain-containing protein n=1 Tax=Adiantum capillus-veneris TaxID=13818 RepID=A0A9D4V4D4_ADICA|nr:hypothetical protein GOP47_0005024 [Adiantum capillus-veneris]
MTHQSASITAARTSPESHGSTALADHNEDLRAIFEHFDENKDGRISKDEMSASLQRLGLIIPPADLTELMDNADANDDGFINYEEFVGLYATLASAGDGGGDVDGGAGEKSAADAELNEAFNVFDKDGDGFISAQELHSVLKSMGVLQGRSVSDCIAMIRRVDSDGNGQVDFEEFKEMMSSGLQ